MGERAVEEGTHGEDSMQAGGRMGWVWWVGLLVGALLFRALDFDVGGRGWSRVIGNVALAAGAGAVVGIIAEGIRAMVVRIRQRKRAAGQDAGDVGVGEDSDETMRRAQEEAGGELPPAEAARRRLGAGISGRKGWFLVGVVVGSMIGALVTAGILWALAVPSEERLARRFIEAEHKHALCEKRVREAFAREAAPPREIPAPRPAAPAPAPGAPERFVVEEVLTVEEVLLGEIERRVREGAARA